MNEEFQTKFKEIHLRSLYKLLGHEGYYSRVGSLDFAKKVITKEGKETFLYEEEYIKGEEALIEYASRYNGIRNIFISRAYRDSSGSVLGTNCITLDLDPIRDKNTASSDEQHTKALDAGRLILGRYPGGYLASSGNGALLLYRLPIALIGLKEHYEKEKVLFKELQELIGKEIKIDSTYYSEAVIKAIGTYSTKGEYNLRRGSRFLNLPILPYQRCDRLCQRIKEIIPTQSTVGAGIDIKALASKFNGDRSIADYHLVNYFKKNGLPAEEALIALKSNSLGRRTDEKDQARLISKIYGRASINIEPNTPSAYFEKLFSPKENSDGTINTGFVELDSALGPLPKGELTTFAARSGFGKTTWGITLAEYWRKQGFRVLYFSTEMAQEYIFHKLVSLSCGIPLTRTIQKQFNEEEITRIKHYKQQFDLLPLVICDEFQPTITLIKNEVIKHKPDIIIFDHITQAGTHWEYVAQFSRDLKDLTSKEGIVTVLLSMLSEPGRGKDGNVTTSIRGDIRGSQEILYLSAIFCMFSNPYDVKGRFQPVDVLVAKNRYGISNQLVPLSCDKEISKYVERLSTNESDLP